MDIFATIATDTMAVIVVPGPVIDATLDPLPYGQAVHTDRAEFEQPRRFENPSIERVRALVIKYFEDEHPFTSTEEERFRAGWAAVDKFAAALAI